MTRWSKVTEPRVTFVQIPLVTKSGGLDPDEADYYAAYWAKMGQVFDHHFQQAEVYTVPEFPLWVTVLGNVCRDAGCDTRFVDLASLTGPKEQIHYDVVASRLAAAPADVYAMSPFTNNYTVAVRVLGLIKERINPDAKVIIGGAHASATQANCMREGFDAVAAGGGEEALGAVLQALTGGDAAWLRRVSGLAWREGDDIRVNPPAKSTRYANFNRLPDYGMIGADYMVHFARIYASLG